MALGLLAGACGAPSDLTTDPGLPAVLTSPSGSGVATPPVTTAGDPAPSTLAPLTPAPAGGTVPAAATFSWAKPAGFDSMLQAAIQAQPSFMDGYGGQIANPFPQLGDTTRFSSMQITRPEAVILANHYGRPSFRFYVDAESRHSNGLRAEFTGVGDFEFTTGDAYNYRFSSYFPSDYKNSSWTEWNMFAQFHSPGFPAWGLHTAGGYLHMKPPSAAENEYRIPMPSRDEWHDFSWDIRWTPDASGSARLFIDGELVFSYSGATMHAGEPYYYPKFGSYLANNPYTQVTYSTPWTISRL